MTARPRLGRLLGPLLGPLLGTVLVAISACGGDGPAPTAISSPAATTVPVRVGSIGDAVEVAAGAPGDAGTVACTTTEQTLTMAADAFLALEGIAPPDQQALVDAGLVREPSPWFEISVDGVVVPAAGGPCA
jgi:hypothetical protein